MEKKAKSLGALSAWQSRSLRVGADSSHPGAVLFLWLCDVVGGGVGSQAASQVHWAISAQSLGLGTAWKARALVGTRPLPARLSAHLRLFLSAASLTRSCQS